MSAIPAEWDAPLSVLAGDLSAQEWARRIGCSAAEVRERAERLGVRVHDESEGDVISLLLDALEDAHRLAGS